MHARQPCTHLQVLFALPVEEDVVQRVDCRLVDHGVSGTLFLSTSHLCFSSLALLAASAAAVVPGGAAASTAAFSLKRSSLFGSSVAAHTNVTLVARLAKIRSMAQGFAKRSKSLVFTLDDNSQVRPRGHAQQFATQPVLPGLVTCAPPCKRHGGCCESSKRTGVGTQPLTSTLLLSPLLGQEPWRMMKRNCTAS